MAYKLNNIDLNTYGIIASKYNGEGIALKGIYDLPKRIGTTHHDWNDSDNEEPYVDADDIFFGDRKIYFKGLLIGDKDSIEDKIKNLKLLIASFNDVVPFETPYGTYCVYVNKITPSLKKGGGVIIIEFIEPIVGATCSVADNQTIYESAEYSETATKNNCDNGYHGSEVELVSPAGKFTSTVSQEAADLLAIQWVRENKQNYANANGTCIVNPTVYYNTKLIGELQKNDCESGEVGTIVTYEVPAYKYSSIVSQFDADAQAQAELDSVLTQSYANENGVCATQFYNEELVFERQKNDCSGNYTGSIESITVPAGTFSSIISQSDADYQALSYAQSELTQEVANSQGTCVTNASLKLHHTEYVKGVLKRFYVIEGPVNVGDTYTVLAYGVKASYTVKSGDDIDDIINGWVDAIRDKDRSDWNAENMYPNTSDTRYEVKSNPKTSWDAIEIKCHISTSLRIFIE